MSFKEQLAKHENILNRFKALYINNENQNKQTNNETLSNSIKINNYENRNINKDNINNSDINKTINNYNFSYGIGMTNRDINNNINNNINYNLDNNNEENLKKIENKKILEKKEEKMNLDLGKIDNLLDKLNFKRENNMNNRLINEEKQNNYKNEDDININTNINNNKKFDIDNIKSKYLNNNINALNITEKYYNNKKEDDSININNSTTLTINNIKKMNQLNSRSEIERIKSKYYSMNLNNIINKRNYLSKDVFLDKNKDNYNLQLNKDILEIKNKLELYRNEVNLLNKKEINEELNQKENSLLNKKELNNELNSFISNKQLNTSDIINNNINNKNDIDMNVSLNKENVISSNKIIENGSNQINIPNLNFKYNIQNNIEQKENNSRKEIEVDINSYENYINNKDQENNMQNNNNGLISEININSNNQMINSNNNDFDYSEVLPIIDKVSKLKDLNEIDDNYDKQNTNSQRMNLINNNVINKEEEVPDIVNNILDALSNKLIISNIENYNNNNKENENIIEKPKLITKNNNTEDKTKKIISFQEFLEKEEKEEKIEDKKE